MYLFHEVEPNHFKTVTWWITYNGYWLLSLSLVLGAVWYFERRFRQKPTSQGMMSTWRWGMIVEGSLFIFLLLFELELAYDLQGLKHCVLMFSAIGCSTLVLIHGGWMLRPRDSQSPRPLAWFWNGPVAWIIEVSVVVFFVSITLSILKPQGRSSRHAARQSQCKSNLRQIGIAMQKWHQEHQRFPDTQIHEKQEPPRSWRVELLPYLDHASLYHQYDRTRAWDELPNSKLRDQRPRIYDCPSIAWRPDQMPEVRSYTSYAALVGPQAAFPGGKGLPLSEFKDGAAHTILIAEACGQRIVWTEPRDVQVTPDNIGVNLPGDRKNFSPAILSSFHPAFFDRPSGACLLFADGSARFVSSKIEPQVLNALVSRDGGDDVDGF